MSLHYLVKREMLIAHVLPLSWYRRKLPNLSHRNCDLQIRHIWIQLITECEKYRKRRCKKYASLIWANCDWERSGTSWITSSLWQPSVSGVVDSSRSVIHVILYTFLQYFPHAVINWIQIWWIWNFGGHSWGGINSGASLSNNAIVARARWAFQVSRQETIFRWGGKRV